MSEVSKERASPFAGLFAFTLRAVIVVMLVAIGIAALLPDIPGALRRELRREETRIRIIGYFTTNPHVHWHVSHIREQKGDLQGALDELELAVALFELHAADKRAPDRYLTRRDELKGKLAQKK